MSLHTLARCGTAAFMVALMAGCSSNSSGSGSGFGAGSTSGAALRSDDCLRNRSSCIYEGSYEQGERAYAEDAARRLNQAQSARLRRGLFR
ncbi:MAG TPA: hypothetical protein VL003_06875 [Pusillimonas sp.]|uniref:hypothetical protein n=1 Tax=Pusillimonas sp. TaxID=3040095 RepID=UPI002CC7869B|nr:hypothetical protein [Pusillimonas sp.]HUH87761.1 hypothetical protein [Pusillimonas sp.]